MLRIWIWYSKDSRNSNSTFNRNSTFLRMIELWKERPGLLIRMLQISYNRSFNRMRTLDRKMRVRSRLAYYLAKDLGGYSKSTKTKEREGRFCQMSILKNKLIEEPHAQPQILIVKTWKGPGRPGVYLPASELMRGSRYWLDLLLLALFIQLKISKNGFTIIKEALKTWR